MLLPGAFYFIRETKLPPVDLFRKHGVPMAVATDCNPGTSPLTSLLLTMNMAATLFRLTVEECLAGVTREAARALGLLDETGTLEAGKCARPRHLGHRAPGRARLPHGLQPAASPHLERPVTATRRSSPAMPRSPTGAPSMRRRAPSLDPACQPRDRGAAPRPSRASSRRASRSMASTPASASSPACASPTADLATLQRNIVLSHCRRRRRADAGAGRRA